MRTVWGRQSVVARRALTVLMLGGLMAPMLAVLGATAPPAGASGGLSESDTTTYVVDPAAGAVHVTVDITARNDKSGYLYYGLSIAALSEATNIRGTRDGGGSFTVTAEPSNVPIAKLLRVRFTDLNYGQTLVGHVMYDLANGAARSNALTRVTTAFTTFEAWASGDPGQGSVHIVVPRSFTVDLVGNTMTRADTGATVTYSADGLRDPYGWAVALSARDDAELVSKDIEVGGNRVKVRAFPDDPQWGTFVDGRVAKGVPELEKLIGQPWPAADGLVITETVTPYLYGYAGWFKRDDNTIEIGDALDPQVILHEMSHLWFNDLLFDDRWIDEGFAQEYSARSVVALGGKLATPHTVDRAARGAVRLAIWSAVNLHDDISQAREAYGYNASWYVIHRITDEIGVARMRRVIAAMSASSMPYRGAVNPESTVGARSWKRFLDDLDEIGRSKSADLIFATYVATNGSSDLFLRKQARSKYHRLLAAEGGWRAPLVVRSAMTDWDFAEADRLMVESNTLLATRDDIGRVVEPLGLRTPAKLKADYEESDLDTVKTEATEDLAAGKALVSATAAVNGQHGLFATIGLIGAKQKSDLAGARRAFVAGDGLGSRDAARRAQQIVDDADGKGKVRAGGVLGSVVALLLVLWVVRTWLRRRRARKAARAEAEAAAADAAAAAAAASAPWSASAPWTPISGAWGESPAPEPVTQPMPEPPAAPDGDPGTGDAEPGPAG